MPFPRIALRVPLVALLLATAVAPIALAQSPGSSPPANVQPASTLQPGANAPSLAEAKVVRGEPIPAFGAGTVYIIYFASELTTAGFEGPSAERLLADIEHRLMGCRVVQVRSGHDLPEITQRCVSAMPDDPCLHFTLLCDQTRQLRTLYGLTAATSGGIVIVDGAGKVAWSTRTLDDVEFVASSVGARRLDSNALANRLVEWARLNEIYEAQCRLDDPEISGTLAAMEKLLPHRRADIAHLRLLALHHSHDRDAVVVEAANMLASDLPSDRRLLRTIEQAGNAARLMEKSIRGAQVEMGALKRLIELDRYCDPAPLARYAAVAAWQEDWKTAVEYQTLAVGAAQTRAGEFRATLEDYQQRLSDKTAPTPHSLRGPVKK
jgi:hypothetical protein